MPEAVVSCTSRYMRTHTDTQICFAVYLAGKPVQTSYVHLLATKYTIFNGMHVNAKHL